METIPIAQRYLDFLWSIFQQDMTNLSQWWMWAFLAVPGIGYLIFFFGRWCVITAPLWLPLFLALSGTRQITRPYEKAVREKGARKTKSAAQEQAAPNNE